MRLGATLVCSEELEQHVLAQWLDLRGVVWFHPPNGGLRHAATAARLRNQGVKPGVPDVVIISRPPRRPTAVGCVLELKRERGGRLAKEQEEWLRLFSERGWVSLVARGATEAIQRLTDLGY